MALDRHKALKAAERFLKAGKVQAAMKELEDLAAASPNDAVTLNRMGDLLARQGRVSDAVGYYVRIAQQFAKQGFYPKSIAIYKKILRIDPDHGDTLAELGELYVRQKLPGEARRYLLRAAEIHLQGREFASARSVYERLVAAEPQDPRHRVRLAECRAAEGDTEQAAEELARVGRVLLDGGKTEDAEKAFRRASDLLPGHPEALLGLAHCLDRAGRAGEVVPFLEEHAGDDASPQLLGELLYHYEAAQRGDDAIALMRRARGPEIPAETVARVLQRHIESASADGWWERAQPVFDDWAAQGHYPQLVGLYSELEELEPGGHLPALLGRFQLEQSGGDRNATIAALERLIGAYRTRSLDGEVEPLLDELRKIGPGSALLSGASPASAAQSRSPSRAAPEPAQAPASAPAAPSATAPEAAVEAAPAAAPAAPEAAVGSAPAPEPVAMEPPSAAVVEPGGVPVHAEAPAVPLNKNDEEFVSGRLTQADILEKYGLRDQSLDQIREVTSKFPGHVNAQQRRVAMLRGSDDLEELRDALVALALARRAAGDGEGARASAAEARGVLELSAETIALMRRLTLLPGDPATPVAPPAAAPAAAAPAATVTRGSVDSPDDVVVIDFDDDSDDDAVPAPAAPAARPPGSDMIEAIRAQIVAGDVDQARKSVETLRSIGYAGDELDAVAADIDRAPAPVSPPAPVETVASEPAEDDFSGLDDDDDDLSAITAALESELFAEVDSSVSHPEAESEQSLEEVFAAFKEHVDAEVGSDDFRTHYDLGIGYKEMGLLDEAIGEFEVSVRSTELFRESCVMLAVCHRERQENERAIDWYRQAIEASGSDQGSASGLRYELAETMLLSGDRAGALSLFRDVFQADPSYRNVRGRIAELEGSPS